MKTFIYSFAFIVVIATFSCSRKTTNTNVSSNQIVQRDGSSYQKAIIIYEKTEKKGIDAEYIWLNEHYPGYESIRQELIQHNDKPYDLLTIKTSDNTEKVIYFEISHFFGK